MSVYFFNYLWNIVDDDGDDVDDFTLTKKPKIKKKNCWNRQNQTQKKQQGTIKQWNISNYRKFYCHMTRFFFFNSPQYYFLYSPSNNCGAV